MARAIRWLLWAGIFMAIPGVSQAVAAEVEHRDYQISVDGKPAGQYHMTIAHQDDGLVVVRGQARVDVRVLLIRYRYTYRGTEVWQDGRLIHLDSTCNDDGKNFTVKAHADADRLRVTSNGEERAVRPDVWTTSCWRLPAAQYRDRALVLLDVDTGREIAGHLQYVGKSKLDVAGQEQECVHYRVTGGKRLELWFDSHEQLVRQESQESGQPYVLQITSVRR
ncbi:MAG TPA: DUF6134 family protein [Gemmataceae bacterium]|jgi:hypothetical protein|nr:DUF6134 family protein [Gemmataceae bacterium]